MQSVLHLITEHSLLAIGVIKKDLAKTPSLIFVLLNASGVQKVN